MDRGAIQRGASPRGERENKDAGSQGQMVWVYSGAPDCCVYKGHSDSVICLQSEFLFDNFLSHARTTERPKMETCSLQSDSYGARQGIGLWWGHHLVAEFML